MSDTQDNLNFIDLDSIVPENEVVVKLGDVRHTLVPITVEDFVANSKAIMNYAKGDKTIEDELTLVTGMLLRAFPTMTQEMLNKLDLIKLNKLSEFAQKHNGQKKVEEQAAAENPPTAS